MLECHKVSVPGRVQAFTTHVSTGSRVHIIGPNGAGKTSLLARIAGMLDGEGHINLAGQALEGITGVQRARLRGYLCQQSLPVSMMPVFQYLSLHQPAGVDTALLEQTIAMLTSALHLQDKLCRPVTRLSGGEWQRVRLVAVLLQVWPTLNPQGTLLLLDEPMNSLDVAQQQALDGLITQFCASGRTAIISDHDLNHTLHHAHQVWLMAKGQVIAAGKREDVMQVNCLTRVFGVNFQMHNVAGRQWLMTTLSEK
ncbi:vitamin B12 ABC transporter ATP-binding protein BtuD [Ewingella americana]|uniref:Vitamin B12 import ATP-binding protein BtuD n=1 Tax=Ewingella americana TaxID=41202 RepID=A0A502GMF6_9GAMM|nr:vitamin B12 ABC transporter ATP-binding protein BtuD [Ewingella americana]TPG62658.1 vitamin B12 ABC transporter ATP-binding protein BtuD [Ewingella americana]